MATILKRLIFEITEKGVDQYNKKMKRSQDITDKLIGGTGSLAPKLRELRGRWQILASTMKNAAIPAAAFLGVLLGLGKASPALQAEMAILDFQMQQIGIVIGDSLVPFFEKLNLAVAAALNWWNDLDPAMKTAIQTMIIVAFTLSVVAVALAAVALAAGPVTAAILLIAMGAAILAFAWETDFLGIQGIAEDVFGVLTDIFQVFADFFSLLFVDPVKAVQDLLSGLWGILTTDTQAFVDGLLLLLIWPFWQFLLLLEIFGVDVTGFFQNLSDMITGAVFGVLNFFGKAFGGIADIVQGVLTLNPELVLQGIEAIASVTGGTTEGAGGGGLGGTGTYQDDLGGPVRGPTTTNTQNVIINVDVNDSSGEAIAEELQDAVRELGLS